MTVNIVLMADNTNSKESAMKRSVVLVLLVLLALLIGACGAPAATTALPAPPSDAASRNSTGGATGQPAESKSDGSSSPTGASVSDHLIIKTASLSLTVKDAQAALDAVQGTAAALGGFVSDSQTVRLDKDRVRVSATIRIPADKFDEALKQVKAAGIRVNTESIKGQDVSEEYTDLNARLRNLEATEKELLALMTTVREKTQRAEDILAVQRELNNVRQQIEQLKGRIQFLDRSVALATITLDLVPETPEAPVTQEGWDPARVARDALRTLATLLQALTNVLIYVVIAVLPILLIFTLPVVLVLRWLRRQRRMAPSA